METHNDFTCLYTWGASNVSAQPHKEVVPRVLEIFDLTRVVQVKCSSNASMALTANGHVYTWKNENPKPVTSLLGINIKKIATTTPGWSSYYSEVSADYGHFACISDINNLYMWGSNRSQQIKGLNQRVYEDAILVMDNVMDVACGDDHTVVVIRNGDVMTWGSEYGPNPKLHLVNQNVVKVSAGGNGFCGALTKDHTLYTWAFNRGVSEGDFTGHDNLRDRDIINPKPVTSLLNNVKYFECGWIHAAAVTLNGDLYTWGEGDTNRLGHGDGDGSRERHKHVPTLVKGMEGTNITRLTLSRGNEGGITDTGDVYTWGGSHHGGHHLNPVPTFLPLSSTFFQGAVVQDLACGKTHTVIVLRMVKSLQYLCFHTMSNYFYQLSEGIVQLPNDLREGLASFMNDRRKWTNEMASLLNVDIDPIPLPPSPPRNNYKDVYFMDDGEDGDDDFVYDSDDSDEDDNIDYNNININNNNNEGGDESDSEDEEDEEEDDINDDININININNNNDNNGDDGNGDIKMQVMNAIDNNQPQIS